MTIETNRANRDTPAQNHAEDVTMDHHDLDLDLSPVPQSRTSDSRWPMIGSSQTKSRDRALTVAIYHNPKWHVAQVVPAMIRQSAEELAVIDAEIPKDPPSGSTGSENALSQRGEDAKTRSPTRYCMPLSVRVCRNATSASTS